MAEYIQALTTTETKEDALAIARSVVEARVAACAQVVGPIESVYWWKGKVDTATEWQIHMKTTLGRYPDLERHVKDTHSYDTPEIIAVPIVRGSAEYLGWLTAETRSEQES